MPSLFFWKGRSESPPASTALAALQEAAAFLDTLPEGPLRYFGHGEDDGKIGGSFRWLGKRCSVLFLEGNFLAQMGQMGQMSKFCFVYLMLLFAWTSRFVTVCTYVVTFLYNPYIHSLTFDAKCRFSPAYELVQQNCFSEFWLVTQSC